jgi:hypothetical protein
VTAKIEDIGVIEDPLAVYDDIPSTDYSWQNPISTIPAPDSIILLAIGLVAVWIRRRVKR